MTTRFLLAGAGYSARAFARRAAPAEFWGTTRRPDGFGRLREAGITPLLFDGTLSDEMKAALAATTHLVVSAAPGEGGDPLLAVLGDGLRRAMPALRWIGYLSTVGVYGDHGGDWVTEDSVCRPRPGRSDGRLQAEQAWQAAASADNVPLAILRLSGIYGPGRNAFVNLAAGTARRIVKQGQIFNRIHVDDIAGSLAFLSQRERGGIYNVSDDEPSPPQDVVDYAARLMGVAPPPEILFETAELSPMARSFYGETKRVSNAKLRDEGYAFAMPNYRVALDAMWRDGSWRG